MILTLDKTCNIAIIGCGTMGKIILDRLLNHGGNANNNEFWCTAKTEEALEKLRKIHPNPRVHFTLNNLEAIRRSDIIFICVKPQNIDSLLDSLDSSSRPPIDDKLFISIAAGVPLAKYLKQIPHIIRAMPNIPCSVGEGMIVLSCHDDSWKKQTPFIEKLLKPLGRAVYLDEKFMNVVTGLSGSGPAFAWYDFHYFNFFSVVIEALADGAVKMGLPKSIALELAAQSFLGTSKLILTSDDHPAKIKDSVTTPGGCTIAGLMTMEDGKIRSVLAKTVEESATVAAQLFTN